MKKQEYDQIAREAFALYERAHIVLTDEEKSNLEITDYALGNVRETGTEIVIYVNTERCCAKEMALLPFQTCPEHRHAPIEAIGYPGKEETFRCRYGKVFLYVSGEPAKSIQAKLPRGVYTVFHEIVLLPGQQYTMHPDTLHWFQAGAEGAVISEFSTTSYDECDIFTDPAIVRTPKIEE